MHRKFAAWLSGNAWRAALFAALFGILSPQGMSPVAVLAGAVPALIGLRVGVNAGVNAAVGGTAAVAALMIGAGQSWPITLGSALGLFWIPLGLAMLLRRSGSLNLVFQLAVLGALGVVGVIYAGMDDAAGQWRALLDDAGQAMVDAGLIDDRRTVVDSLVSSNWGTYVTLWLLTIVCAVFVGRWWQSLLEAPGAFGGEYRQLRFGKVLGIVAVAVMMIGLAGPKFGMSVPVVEAWMWVVIAGLAFQGLAAAHKLKAAGIIGRAWLTAIYVLLVVPVSTQLIVTLLAGWGLADNWRRVPARGA